jgi:hypothetical protein
VKTASSFSGNHPFLGPVDFLCDALDSLIAALCFCHSRMLLSSTPKIAAALRFPFSSVHQITSRLNFAIYESNIQDFCNTSLKLLSKDAMHMPVVPHYASNSSISFVYGLQ